MKRRALIQQHEFTFSAGAFNLAQDEAQDGQRIQREREQSERDRAQSEAGQSSFVNDAAFEDAALYQKRISDHAKGKLVCWHCNALISDPIYKNQKLQAGTFCDEACEDARIEFLEVASFPGLRPGSSWSMVKALANLQRGEG